MTQNPQPVVLRSAPPQLVDPRRTLNHLHWYLQPLRRWAIFILLAALAIGAVTYLLEVRFIKPVYQGAAVVEVEYPPPTGNLGGGQDFLSSEEYASSTAPRLIHSTQVAFSTLKLIQKYLAGYYTKPTAYPQVTQLYASIGTPTASESAAIGKLLPAGPITNVNKSDVQRRAQHILSSTSAVPIANSNSVTVTGSSETPFVAAVIANAMAIASSGYQASVQNSAFDSTLANIQGAIASDNAKLKLAKAHKPPLYSQIRILQTAITTEQANYATVSANASLSAIKFLVSVPATIPVSPVSPHPLRTGLLAGVIALLVLISGLMLREFFSTTLRTPEEVSEAVGGAPVLGAILRQAASKGPGPALTADPRSATAEGLRVIRTNLLFANVDRPPRTILLTSARQAEGKTTISSNLAASMAELGGRVLLVDADLRKPSQGKVFGIDSRVGLTNALVAASNEPLDGFVKRVEGFHGLSVMPSGPIPPNPAELLSSGRMRELLQRLYSTYDTVIIDSPPLLAVADPAILATMTEAVILVLDVDQATLQSASRTREALEHVGARITGVVLNKLSDDQRGSYYYNYYYRREYGYGYAPERTDQPRDGKSVAG